MSLFGLEAIHSVTQHLGLSPYVRGPHRHFRNVQPSALDLHLPMSAGCWHAEGEKERERLLRVVEIDRRRSDSLRHRLGVHTYVDTPACVYLRGEGRVQLSSGFLPLLQKDRLLFFPKKLWGGGESEGPRKKESKKKKTSGRQEGAFAEKRKRRRGEWTLMRGHQRRSGHRGETGTRMQEEREKKDRNRNSVSILLAKI